MRNSPAAERNKVPISEVLSRFFLDSEATDNPRRVLEIASGCGTHAMHFSSKFPKILWQPSDVEPEMLTSIRAHLKADRRANVLPPLQIDVCKPVQEWLLQYDSYHFMFNANMIHISPWICTESLFASAGRLLLRDGLLFTYGPYRIDGILEPESNQQFDSSLRMQCSDWGIREIRDLEKEASRNGLALQECIDMPANNKILAWKKMSSQ